MAPPFELQRKSEGGRKEKSRSGKTEDEDQMVKKDGREEGEGSMVGRVR